MTNKEFYGNKLLAIAIWERDNCQLLHELVFNKTCQKKSCSECEFCNVESIENWLNAEHKEPLLLENGDGLKSGDWIMVKEPGDEVWDKKIFAYYYDGRFYCANDIAHFKNGLLVSGTRARLP